MHLAGKIVLFDHIDTMFTYLNLETEFFKDANAAMIEGIRKYVKWMDFILDSLLNWYENFLMNTEINSNIKNLNGEISYGNKKIGLQFFCM